MQQDPVMPFRIHETWLAMRLEQIESVVADARLWPVPLVREEYVGLLDHAGTLVPVLALDPDGVSECNLVALLRVRGNMVGLAVAEAGHLTDHYWVDERAGERKPLDGPQGLRLRPGQAQAVRNRERAFWLVDTQNLWLESSPTSSGA